MPKKLAPEVLSPKERCFIEVVLANPGLSYEQAALAAGYAKGSVNKLLHRKRVKTALAAALQKKTDHVAEKAAEIEVDYREQLLQELFQDVHAPGFDERVERAARHCPRVFHYKGEIVEARGCDSHVYAALLAARFKAAELLAKVLLLLDPDVPHSTDDLERFIAAQGSIPRPAGEGSAPATPEPLPASSRGIL